MIVACAYFSAGHGFAGQRRLVDEKILGFEQAEFGRNYVAGGKSDDISGHELFRWEFLRNGLFASLGCA